MAAFSTSTVALYSYIPYIRDMIAGKSKPHPASWFIWSVLSIIILTSQLSINHHLGASLYLFIAQAVGITITFLYSAKYGDIKLTRTDFLLLFVAIQSITIWNYTNDPRWALLILIGIDIVGGYLTVKKTWADKTSETHITWTASCIAAFTAIVAVSGASAWLYIYPIYTALLNVLVLLAIKFGKNPK